MAVTKAPQKKGAAKAKVQKTIKKDDKKGSLAGAVSKDFTVDEDARHEGECVYYNKGSGYGFIKLTESGIVPDDKVMCYWKDITTEDRWPSLYKGFKCELSLKVAKRGNQTTVRAKEVTAPGGESVAIQDENEDKKEYVGDKHMRFLGNVKFYDFQKGFGYVKLQEGYAIDEDVPKELRVVRAEINAGDDAPRLSNEMEVEFGISKNKKGQYACYNVTLPGGDVVSRNVVEGRSEFGKTTYTGEITMWNRMGGYGWIKPESSAKFPAEIKKAMTEDHEKRSKKLEKAGKDAPKEQSLYFRRGDRADFDSKIGKGVKVTFGVYKDNQGVGACNVTCK